MQDNEGRRNSNNIHDVTVLRNQEPTMELGDWGTAVRLACVCAQDSHKSDPVKFARQPKYGDIYKVPNRHSPQRQ